MNSKYTKKIEAIRSQSIVDVVYQQIQELILTDKISSGERINEYQLSDVMGVSRTAIREACRKLEKEGLVYIRKNQGVIVTDVSAKEALELYEIRAALEALAAEKAAKQARIEHFNKLEELLQNHRKHFRTNDMESYFNNAIDFHWTIIKASRNQSLISILEIIINKQRLFRKREFSENQESSIKENESIFKALKRRNGKESAKLMKQHILAGRERLINQLNQSKSAA